ncbi:hypothetical protein V6N12_012436 [Hibiscus sabdariffa]|uniref:BRCT domain-containing protein n=1 Tax=Hibiscus sabdariffa TaxID=183260 RepID=A0ABR2AB20_9ROSI
MGGLNNVEVINSKGCSRLFVGFSSPVPSFRSFQSFEPMSPAPTTSLACEPVTVRSTGPFSGLVICVTGLSKEARKQVMEATERLGGQYSTSLHPQCTHLVVQNVSGRKFEHALKHGSRNGLFLVKLGWFVDSVKRNVRLSESLYVVKGVGEHFTPEDELNRLAESTANKSSCLPAGFHEAKKIDMIEKPHARFYRRGPNKSMNSMLSGYTMYIDSDISVELQNKVLEAASKEGATVVDQWFVGCSPLWVLKTAKDRNLQRLVHMSADLARQIRTVLENAQNAIVGETGQNPIHPISPTSLLEPVCWSISEPTSTASIFTDTVCGEDVSDHQTVFFDANDDGKGSEASVTNLTRSLTESEQNELILKNHFLTILFPVDQFSEIGPSSRTYFSDKGFTCLQILDYIYAFYQENMSVHEIEAGIHTDSSHADQLRSAYSSEVTVERGYMDFKRINFLGIRKSFEMLKRVSGDSNTNVYELLIRA